MYYLQTVIEDFRRRYTKPDRYTRRGPEYVASVLQSARENLEKYGFSIISTHDSITGEVVSYYPRSRTAATEQQS